MARKHSKDHGGGPTRAIEALTAAGVAFTVHEYEHDPAARAFGEETVEKLGIDPTQAFKTLMVRLEPTGEFVVVSPAGYIRTYYLTDRDYFERQ